MITKKDNKLKNYLVLSFAKNFELALDGSLMLSGEPSNFQISCLIFRSLRVIPGSQQSDLTAICPFVLARLGEKHNNVSLNSIGFLLTIGSVRCGQHSFLDPLLKPSFLM